MLFFLNKKISYKIGIIFVSVLMLKYSSLFCFLEVPWEVRCVSMREGGSFNE